MHMNICEIITPFPSQIRIASLQIFQIFEMFASEETCFLRKCYKNNVVILPESLRTLLYVACTQMTQIL